MVNQTLAHIINNGNRNGTSRILIRYSKNIKRIINWIRYYNIASIGILYSKSALYYAFASKSGVKQSARGLITISKRKHKIYISYFTLRLLVTRLGASVLFLETEYGVITHIKALTLRIGGCLLSCLTL